MKFWFRISIFFNFIVLVGACASVWNLGGLNYVFHLFENKGSGMAAQKTQRHNHFASLPMRENVVIMLGNSLTAACEWAELFQNPNVLNRGTASDTSDDILARLDEIVRHKPTQIFVWIGVNDLLFHPPQYVAENVEKIVRQLQNSLPKTRVMAISLLPVHDNLKQQIIKNDDIQKVNTLLATKLNHRTENGLVFLNLHHHFCEPNRAILRADLSLDGIHINEKGYFIIKEQLKPFVKL